MINDKEKSTIVILISIFCIIMIMMSLWLVDISVTGLLAGKGSVLTNGFIVSTPMKMYHLGLYSIIIFSTILTMLVVYVRTK